MEFRFDPDTLDLRDGARAFLEGENTAERLRGLAQGGDPLALWPRLAEMGLLGASAPEAQGGLGLSGAAQMLLCEEAGRAGLPEPYSDTAAILVPALAWLGGQAANQIEAICAGEQRGIVVHMLNPFANFSAGADFVLQYMPGRMVLAEQGHFVVEPRDSIDPGRKLSSITLRGGEELLTGEAADRLGDELALRGAVAAAAELCGLSARMIALATDYSKTREQFGRAIGSFQAVKHLMANAQVKLEFARPVVYRAGELLSEAGHKATRLAVAHAKIAASDAAILATENAIQVFGGMGYTFEVDLHFFMKRVWALCGQWGDRNHHMKLVDASILGSPRRIGPGETFSNQSEHNYA